jgi:hypothetical protein
MRSVEGNIRNKAAHNIVAVKESHFTRAAGISSEKLIRDMQWLYKYIYPQYFPAGNDPWDSYNQMNNEIIARLKA